MDTQKALIEAVWGRLSRDGELNEMFKGNAGERLHLTWAPKDSPFPYMVHRFKHSRSDTTVKNGRWYLDFWGHEESPEPNINRACRTIELMEGAILGLSSTGELIWVDGFTKPAAILGRFKLLDDGDVPEDTEGIWHYTTVWSVRWALSPGQITRLLKAKE